MAFPREKPREFRERQPFPARGARGAPFLHSSDKYPANRATSLEKMLEEDGRTADPAEAESVPLRQAQQAARRRANLAVALIPVLVLLITFLFWYQTWFGRRLSASEMNQYLTDTSVPHKTQHALSQLADQIARHDPEALRWYPQILALAGDKEPEFRMMSAWVMGQDNQSVQFHEALRRLLDDSEPMVRRNAALGLVRFGDSSGERELRLMLEPFELAASAEGEIEYRLKESDEVERSIVVAQIETGSAKPLEVHSPVEGVFERRTISNGAQVTAGETIAVLSPSEPQVWESLRALYLVGGRDSLTDVERFERGVPGMSERVRQQAALTVQAIQKRVASGK
jgi:HEAT repeats